MNDNKYDIKERQTVPNGKSNLSKNKLTKSYTSFHPKKTLSKNKSNKNPPKNLEYLNHKKYSKTNRIYFSNKKEKDFDYLEINHLSPQNKFNDINKNHIYMNNIPSSDHLLNKCNKRYVFDNIKKFRTNLIMDYNLKTNNNEENKNTEKNIIKENSISSNNNDNNSKKTNGASSNNIINNNIVLNNSLIRSSENFLNTIAMTLTNNNNETSIQSNRVRFCGLNNIGLGWSTNKRVNNLNDFYTNSRSKMLNKFKKKTNQIIKNEKKMNNLKNQNLNSIKKTVLFKTKSKAKMKSSHHIYSKENKKNSSKKYNKSSTNIANSIVTNANTNSNNIKQTDNNNNLPLDESDKTKMNEESNNNSDKNINDKDLFYQTVENNHFNGDIINNNFNFLNIINTNNKRNNDSQKEDTIKTLNTMKSYQQSVNENNNMNTGSHKIIINNNINNIENHIIESIESKDDIAFQTYSGSFRQNIIKVNILDKAKILNKKIESIKSSIIDNDTINNNDQKTILKSNNRTKSANNLMANISNSNIIKEDDKINLYITTEMHSNKKNGKINLKNNIINKFNKNTLDQSNKYKNSTITNHSLKKKDFKLNKQKTECNKNIKNNIKQNKFINSLNCSQSNYKTNKANTPSISNTLNSNLYPLNRAKTRGYIKKKSSTSNLNHQSSNGNPNLTSNTNRTSVYNHKKNNSISSSIYNTQRTIKQNRLNLKYKNNKNNKNNKNKKKNNLYSSPKNEVEIYQENKSILVPEYTIKFENIKSRVSNLLNIYSLLALKSINDINNKEIEENEEIEINENEN